MYAHSQQEEEETDEEPEPIAVQAARPNKASSRLDTVPLDPLLQLTRQPYRQPAHSGCGPFEAGSTWVGSQSDGVRVLNVGLRVVDVDLVRGNASGESAALEFAMMLKTFR